MEDFNFRSRNFEIKGNKSDLHEKPKPEEKSKPITRIPTLSDASTNHEEVILPLN